MKITLFGNFGSPNYGNETTLLTVLWHLRRLRPSSEFCCVCPNPSVVTERYGIDAVPIDLGRRLWRPKILQQYGRALRLLKGSDIFLIPGTGLLTDAFGFPDWGLYGVLKWSLLAKLCRCRVVFLSVGAGPIYSAKGRFLLKSALSLADYRSYRDDSSKTSLQEIGFRVDHDRVYPDLVFSLPDSLVPPTVNGDHRERGRLVVGLGLMSYAGRYSTRSPSQKIYSAYLDALVTLVEWLLDHGYDIRLLSGDDGDAVVIREFISLLRTRLGTFDERRVLHEPLVSVPGLLSQFAATDMVVATRFHNVLFALLLEKPVVAISFHHKCTSLMAEMGLSAYSHDINEMDAGELIRQFQELEREPTELQTGVHERLQECRAASDEQFDLLFETRE